MATNPVKPQSDAQRACNPVWLKSQLREIRRIVQLREIPRTELFNMLDDIDAGRVRGVVAEPTPAEVERAAQRAKHTCMKTMESRSCRACNAGIPYPHPSVDEIERELARYRAVKR